MVQVTPSVDQSQPLPQGSAVVVVDVELLSGTPQSLAQTQLVLVLWHGFTGSLGYGE